MANYPLSDGTNSEMVLYPAGVDSFNEDYQESEELREHEDKTRFNSIVKVSGIVAKKADWTVKLFPTVVSGNQIAISSGVGYTGNGAEINVESDLTISDITALTGYVAPSGTNNVYLVLRKYAQDYATRPHPITGIQKYTRRMIKSDSSIVEFIVKSGSGKNDAITDRDVIVLGRLSSVSPAVFDTTEATGFRKILRVTETLAVEVGIPNTMENDIYFQNRYNCFDFPQFGEQYYKLNGAVNNKDFQRLIAKTTSQLSVLRGVKFQAVTGGYGIQFANDSSIKIKIFPAQQPPQTVDIIQQNIQVAIPDNHMMYITLSDAQLLITAGGGGGLPIEEGDGVIGGGGIAGSFSTASLSSSNIGTTVGSNLRKFPICWHYYNAVTGQRSLIFLDGTLLNLNDEITTEGYHSANLRRAGVDVANNYMTGNLEIRKNSGKVILTQGSEGVLANDITTGIEWRKAPPFNSVVIGEFKRFILGNAGGSDSPPSGIEDYDFYLNAFDNDGLNGKSFVFKKDGRAQADTPARSAKDLLRLNEGFDKRGDDLANNSISGNVTIAKDNPQLILQDTTAISGFQGIQIKKADGGGLGYFERQSESGSDSIFSDGYNAGDWLWATTDNNGLNGRGVRLSINTGHLIMPKAVVQSDGTVGNNLTVSNQLYVYQNIRLPYLSVNPSSESGLGTIYHIQYGSTLAGTDLVDRQVRYGYSPSQQYSLVNYTDGTGATVTVTSSESTALCSTALPTYTAYNKILVTLNISVKITGNTGEYENLVIKLKNQAGTVLGVFKPNVSCVSGMNNPFYRFNFTQVVNSSSSNTSLYFTVSRSSGGANTVALTNDTTDGFTRLDYVVLN